jgi:hypothetical protein
MSTRIHRASLQGGAICQANTPRLSVSGAVVTCHDWLRLSQPPSRQALLKQLEAVVENRKVLTSPS